MSELTEKQKCYARYLAKQAEAQRNGILANMKPSFRALLRNYIESELVVKSQSLSAAKIAQLEPLVREMYLARLKKESPMKHEFLLPMVESFLALNKPKSKIMIIGGRRNGITTLFNEFKKMEKTEC
jgi:hypothetical protein